MPIKTCPRLRVGSLSSCPSDENPAQAEPVSRAITDVKEALRRTEDNFTVGLALEGEMRLFDKIEEVPVPVVRFDDAPAANKGLRRRAPWPSAGLRDQLGQPHKIVGGSSERSMRRDHSPRSRSTLVRLSS